RRERLAGRQAVERVVELDGGEPFGVVAEPGALRQAVGIEAATPVAVAPATGPDVHRHRAPPSRSTPERSWALPVPFPRRAASCPAGSGRNRTVRLGRIVRLRAPGRRRTGTPPPRAERRGGRTPPIRW